jgi:hypothetical protein
VIDVPVPGFIGAHGYDDFSQPGRCRLLSYADTCVQPLFHYNSTYGCCYLALVLRQRYALISADAKSHENEQNHANRRGNSVPPGY